MSAVENVLESLARTQKRNVKSSIKNCMNNLYREPVLKDAICKNELTNKTDIVKLFPFLCGGVNSCAVTGNGKAHEIDEAIPVGFQEKRLFEYLEKAEAWLHILRTPNQKVCTGCAGTICPINQGREAPHSLGGLSPPPFF